MVKKTMSLRILFYVIFIILVTSYRYKGDAMNKNLIFVFIVFLSLTGLSGQAFAKDLKIYKFGKEPKLDVQMIDEPLYKTKNLTQPPFMIKIERINDKKYNSIVKGSPYWDYYSSKEGINMNFLRVLLMNPSYNYYKNITIHIHHYLVDKPKYVSSYGIRKTYDSSKVKLFETEINTITAIPKNSKIVIDTHGIKTSFSETRAGDVGYYSGAYHRDASDVYAGYIISFFSNGKLLLQMTNNKALEEKGIKNLSADEVEGVVETSEE
jgi:hypothetical protein